jgi:hypothetical protein
LPTSTIEQKGGRGIPLNPVREYEIGIATIGDYSLFYKDDFIGRGFFLETVELFSIREFIGII